MTQVIREGGATLLTRRQRWASPDKNRESVGSGIDRASGRPVTFALPTAHGSLAIRPPDLLLIQHVWLPHACAGKRDGTKEERGW
jgi:hypothetical protein